MQTQQIFDLARQAGFDFINGWRDDGETCEYGEAWPEQIETFAKLVAKTKAEELATELEKGPLNDTATSIAIWIRSQE